MEFDDLFYNAKLMFSLFNAKHLIGSNKSQTDFSYEFLQEQHLLLQVLDLI